MCHQPWLCVRTAAWSVLVTDRRRSGMQNGRKNSSARASGRGVKYSRMLRQRKEEFSVT